MHPEVIQDEPGICPICHMDLVPLRQDEAPRDAHELWTCPMHPEILEEEPGSCPICKMDLVKVKDDMGMDSVPVSADEAEVRGRTGGGGDHRRCRPTEHERRHRERQSEGHQPRDPHRGLSRLRPGADGLGDHQVPGLHREDLCQLHRPAGEEGRAVVRNLRARAGADRAGAVGRPALRREQSGVGARRCTVPAPRPRSKRRVSASRYWDVSPEQIAELEETGEVFRTLQVLAPASGVVMLRMSGLEGMATQPGMELLHIADLSNLWLTVEVFDNQLPWIDVGSPATVSLSYFPGVTYRGRVRYIEPEVSEKTRTVQLTLDVPNRDGRLRVGMYATVVFEPVAAADASDGAVGGGAPHRSTRPRDRRPRRRSVRPTRSRPRSPRRRFGPGPRRPRRRRRGRHLGAVPDRLRVEPQRGHSEDDRRQAWGRWVMTPQEFGIRNSEFGISDPPITSRTRSRFRPTRHAGRLHELGQCQWRLVGQPSWHAGRVPHNGPREDQLRSCGAAVPHARTRTPRGRRSGPGRYCGADVPARPPVARTAQCQSAGRCTRRSWHARRIPHTRNQRGSVAVLWGSRRGTRDASPHKGSSRRGPVGRFFWDMPVMVRADRHPSRDPKRTGGDLWGSRPGCHQGGAASPRPSRPVIPTGGPQGRSGGDLDAADRL